VSADQRSRKQPINPGMACDITSHPKPRNYKERCSQVPRGNQLGKSIQWSLISTTMSGGAANFPIDLTQYKKLRAISSFEGHTHLSSHIG